MTDEKLARRQLLQTGATLLLALGAGPAFAAVSRIPITVHRDAACGCCGEWIKYLAASGRFAPVERIEADMQAIKTSLRVPGTLASCHTALVQGYVIEGHVPAEDILRLLQKKPLNIRGLSVPGMVPGSPGMEVPGVSAPYAVVAFDGSGRSTIFSRYTGRPKSA
jgi:hypothetical protein